MLEAVSSEGRGMSSRAAFPTDVRERWCYLSTSSNPRKRLITLHGQVAPTSDFGEPKIYILNEPLSYSPPQARHLFYRAELKDGGYLA